MVIGYVIMSEFPRPQESGPGSHNLATTATHAALFLASHLFVR